MEDNKIDMMSMALAKLQALKTNIPKGLGVSAKYADEYNSAIDYLLNMQNDELLIKEKIDQSEIYNPITGITNEKTYYGERSIRRDFLMSKIDTVLGYFTLKLQPTQIKNKIGFSVEQSE